MTISPQPPVEESVETPSQDEQDPATPARTSANPARWITRGLLIGGIAVLAAAAVVIGLDALPKEERKGPAKIPTYGVVYSVTGKDSVGVSFNEGGGRSGNLSPAELPWTKKVAMPADGSPPTMEITLGEKGGRAECALAVHGRVVSRSVAQGEFGRATCGTQAPTTAPPVTPDY
ncbi:hypothetical protein [Streptomyces sp. NPDC002133]|uniref:hypothetical protein n=1 Tax=Streptomyces sp. NPDC002133 TaxID=3154409 RepID=UPI0033299575